MMERTDVTVTEITAVATKIESSPELTQRERAIMALVFSLAGEAAAEREREVSGFMPTAVERNLLELGSLHTPIAPLQLHAPGSFAEQFLAGLGDGSVRPVVH